MMLVMKGMKKAIVKVKMMKTKTIMILKNNLKAEC